MSFLDLQEVSARGGWAKYGAISKLFSHGFQLAFTFKTVVKALDYDLHFVQCYIIPLTGQSERMKN